MALGLVLLVGCNYPRELVIEDSPQTMIALQGVVELESLAGCRLFRAIRVVDELEDRYSRGTTTIRWVPEGSLREGELLGRAEWRLRNRAHIRLDESVDSAVVAHELLHTLGLEHDETWGLMGARHADWSKVVDEEVEAIRSRCLD